jgi:hypothetical protein
MVMAPPGDMLEDIADFSADGVCEDSNDLVVVTKAESARKIFIFEGL